MNELTPASAASERCERSSNMSKAQALRDLVMERLVVAADEIFALFERTFAEYEEEFARTKHLQPRIETHKEDAPTLILNPEVHPQSPEHMDEEQTVHVKQEEDHSFEFSAAYSVKSEENMGILLPEPVEEDVVDPTEEQCAVEEEPGCSLNLQTDNNEQNYDTDDSEDWRPTDVKKSPKSAGLKKDSKRGRAARNANVLLDKNTASESNCEGVANGGVQTLRESPEAALRHHRPNESSRHEPYGDQNPGCSADLINLPPNYGSDSCCDASELGNPAKESTETQNGRQEFNFRLADDSKRRRTNANTSLLMTNCDIGGLEMCSKDVASVDSRDKNERYDCLECGAAFQTVELLQNHSVLHSSRRPFRCPTCHKVFRQKYSLKEHMRIHTDEKPFCCPDCGMRVRHQHTLMRHVLTVHRGQKPYSCPVCKKAFSQKGHYNIHMRMHTGEKPFSCPVCGKGFRAKYCLKRHIKTHSDPAGAQTEVKVEANCT